MEVFIARGTRSVQIFTIIPIFIKVKNTPTLAHLTRKYRPISIILNNTVDTVCWPYFHVDVFPTDSKTGCKYFNPFSSRTYTFHSCYTPNKYEPPKEKRKKKKEERWPSSRYCGALSHFTERIVSLDGNTFLNNVFGLPRWTRRPNLTYKGLFIFRLSTYECSYSRILRFSPFSLFLFSLENFSRSGLGFRSSTNKYVAHIMYKILII